MPPGATWQTFFDPETVLTRLSLTANHQCVVDFGCGFGTFAIPAARIVQGTVHAIDIDPEMVAATRIKARELGLSNLLAAQSDFVQKGCELSDDSVDYVMLFNILHAQEADALLAEARRLLGRDGILAVIHWNYDPATPRGPSMEIRPMPAGCQNLVRKAGFKVAPLVDLPPYHYGFTARRD